MKNNLSRRNPKCEPIKFKLCTTKMDTFFFSEMSGCEDGIAKYQGIMQFRQKIQYLFSNKYIVC